MLKLCREIGHTDFIIANLGGHQFPQISHTFMIRHGNCPVPHRIKTGCCMPEVGTYGTNFTQLVLGSLINVFNRKSTPGWMIVGKGVALHVGQPQCRYRHLINFPVKPCQLSSCCVKENANLKVPLAANLVFDHHRCRPRGACYIGLVARRIAVVRVCACRRLFEILHAGIVLALPSRFCNCDVCQDSVHFYRNYCGLSVLLAK